MNKDRQSYQTEDALIRSLKSGSQQAFDSIYRLYARQLYSFSLSYTKSPEDAEEIVQDVFVRLWNSRATIRQEETLRSLLFILAKNLLINAYRRKVNHPIYEEYVEYLEVHSDADADRTILYEEFVVEFQKSLHQLPPTQQKVITLSKRDELSNKEIAAKLELSEQTVKNQLSIGLKTLRSLINATRK
jgi:RNA polymerase sigma-70 factor (ECF subfamily)